MPPESRSLRRRLLTWLLLPLLLLFMLRGSYTYYYAHQLADRVYDRMLLTLASSLTEQIVYNAASGRIELPGAAADLLMPDELDRLYYAIRNARGEIRDGDRRMPPVSADLSGNEPFFFDGRIDGQAVRIAHVPLTLEHRPYTLEVAETLNKRMLLAREFQVGTLLPQAAIILLATLVVWFGVGRGLAPLKRVQHAVSERSHLDLRPLHETDIPAEVQPLIQSINDLMARLSDSLEAQNRFIADAAHQLRTPLAGLKTQIEFALRQDDPAMTARAIKYLLESTDRMTRLVNQLLALSRNERGAEGALRKEVLDLGQLASNVTMEWVPRALEKGIDLGFEAPRTQVVIEGDASRLKDLLENLIDNALRYSPPAGQVTVSVVAGERPQLFVTDNGPGIPPEQRERVFERFYSLLGSGAEGSGLGLAIVREIASIHDAETRIDSAPNGSGTRVSVRFATAPPSLTAGQVLRSGSAPVPASGSRDSSAR
jgi:two-component system sensor histidine kinase TctE